MEALSQSNVLATVVRRLATAIAMTAMAIVALVSVAFLLLNKRFLKGQK